MKLNILPAHINLFLEDLWKDTRRLQIDSHNNRITIRRYTDNQTSIQEEHALLLWLNDMITFRIPRIISYTDQFISYEYIRGTRAFNLMKDLKALYDVNAEKRYLALCEKLIDCLQADLMEFQNKTLPELHLNQASRKYPAFEKISNLYKLLTEILCLDSWQGGAIVHEVEKIIAVYSNCSEFHFRDATPKNAILNIPELHRSGVENRLERLDVVRQMVDSGKLERLLINENIYHIDFSGCLFLCPKSDDWIALLHHEATHWLSKKLGNGYAMDDPEYLSALFVRYSRFGGRKLAYRLLNWSGYRIRFGLDNEAFYFIQLKKICDQMKDVGIINNNNLSSLMDMLLKFCNYSPQIDYLHHFKNDLKNTQYYQDVFPN